mmetsp:Transcript_3315/g.11674  ORF Transcript_3315/g.11674 Transcript_3315/m.11674 type:complete len:313 (-) Transcript_3315:251-1189(-)
MPSEPYRAASFSASKVSMAVFHLAMAASASTSIAYKFSWMHTGSGPSACNMASPSECAGSVDTISVRSPASAYLIAIALETDVLPTPPLPPTTMMRQAFFRAALARSESQPLSGVNAACAKNRSAAAPTSSAVSMTGTSVRRSDASGSLAVAASMQRRCVAARRCTCSGPKPASGTTRFSTMDRSATPPPLNSLRKESASRSDSRKDSSVGSATMTNSVVVASRSFSRASFMVPRSASSCDVSASTSSTTAPTLAPMPNAPPARRARPETRSLRPTSLSSRPSANCGRSSSRSAWPVGAVSTTTLSKPSSSA